MKDKIIKDIRYFESDYENKDGNLLPSYVGVIYKFPNSVHQVSDRIARKLNQYNFISGTYDHIYINFSTYLQENEFSISNRFTEGWYKYIDYGLDPRKVNSLTDLEKENIIEVYTFKILRILYKNDKSRMEILEIAENEIMKYGSEVEIIYKIKETNSYKATLSYKINPHGGKSCAFLDYLNKKNGKGIKKKILDLHSFIDIYPLADLIVVKEDKVILQPKKSYKAQLFTSSYRIPVTVNIKEIE